MAKNKIGQSLEVLKRDFQGNKNITSKKKQLLSQVMRTIIL